MIKACAFFAVVLFFYNLSAQVIAPSAEEVEYSYTAEFRTSRSQAQDLDGLAYFHASHIFGLLHTSQITKAHQMNYDKIEGIGAPRAQFNIRIQNTYLDSSGKLAIKYSAKGKMLLHHNAAKLILSRGGLNLPLPADPDDIYNKNCTDDYYNSSEDYWYFYDVFRAGCSYLSKEPYALLIPVRVWKKVAKKTEQNLKLSALRGNNQNGQTFSIYVIHGYAESVHSPNDDGRALFKELNEELLKQNFTEKVLYKNTNRPLHIFSKSVKLESGKVIDIEIKHTLVETSADSKTVSFAKFFKQAVESADVIIYSGHSGLGGNLDLAVLESKAGKFSFDKYKRQVYFFDSCSSYSYYLEPFLMEKTKSKIDVITNGLSSYFHTGNIILGKFLRFLLSESEKDPTWHEVLNEMEKPLKGGSYLINVGGI